MTSSYITMGLKPYEKEKKMVTAAILAAIMGIGSAVIILTLYALHRLTGGKMSLKKWAHLNFDF